MIHKVSTFNKSGLKNYIISRKKQCKIFNKIPHKTYKIQSRVSKYVVSTSYMSERTCFISVNGRAGTGECLATSPGK